MPDDSTKIAPCLWFDGKAEEAANFYVSIFPDSSVNAINRSATDWPEGKAGDVITVEFTLLGNAFLGLNGGPAFRFNEAVSFQVYTDNQEETDRYWNALIADGGAESACSWCRDKYGLHWQIAPRALMAAISNPDHAAAKRAMEAMMTMTKIDIAAIEAAVNGA
ncbi:VOC family protein [Parasphingopyxis lamellibrachiae]|uniref:2-polyprenyl-6-hydroxyphenyl methylase/3-demethylubiquinone-9 3-methyltransferase n=1 Tax=Parasphingopyxis lamellibrachiae TaxID=680125 RepID=A0A3D9FDW1_9SPHN|nr:VOC family protein [Parasphingopyxis lamellibrachiae]RED16010.1 2-polyprenyl-6-hydroxyphenyl methylase/3-demethylubiquinone-9 3-methyltransferase [Parasphingopyxis lamellibrachiae]